MGNRPLRLYRFRLSGHSHRVELFLSILGLAFESIEVELGKGEHKTPEFLARNRFGQVPVLDDDGLVLADSNAILVHLAMTRDPERTWYPADPVRAAAVQRWLSVAAGPLVAGPALARLVGIFGAAHDLPRAHATAKQLFSVMEAHLQDSGGFFVGRRPTIADIALYTYTAHAPEGHLDLGPHAAIRAWLREVEKLPGYVGMVRTEPRFGFPGGA
ncbi:MAG: glutathione S-transferase family protein [Candidatus Binatia bacterium]